MRAAIAFKKLFANYRSHAAIASYNTDDTVSSKKLCLATSDDS